MSDKKYRSWCFTLWLDCTCPICQFYPSPLARAESGKFNLKYLIYQMEACPQTGRYHMQGYMQWNTSYKLSYLKKHWCTQKCHFEPAGGSPATNIEYCSKDASRVPDTETVEWGTRPSQGSRTDIQALQVMVMEQRPFREIAETHFHAFLRFNRGIRDAMTLFRQERSEPCFTIVYWGPPGTGKTRRAAHEAGPDAYWLPAPNQSGGAVWWDGYEGQTVVIIDEFYGWIPLNFMNRLCDRYPMRVQTKGGNVPFLATRIYITSNVHPNEWWPRTFAKSGNLGAMDRRLTGDSGAIEHMPGPDVWEPPVEEPLEPIPLDEQLIMAQQVCNICQERVCTMGSICEECKKVIFSSQVPLPETQINLDSQELEGSSADEVANTQDMEFINDSSDEESDYETSE